MSSTEETLDVNETDKASGLPRTTIVLGALLAVAVAGAIMLLFLFLGASSDVSKKNTQLAEVTAVMVMKQQQLATAQQQLTVLQTAQQKNDAAKLLCGTYISSLDATTANQTGLVVRGIVSHVSGDSMLKLQLWIAGRMPLASSLAFTGNESTWNVSNNNVSSTVSINTGFLSITSDGSSTMSLVRLDETRMVLANLQGVYRKTAGESLNQLAVGYNPVTATVTIVQNVGPLEGNINLGTYVDGGVVLVDGLSWTLSANASGNYDIPYSSGWNIQSSGILEWNPHVMTITQRQTLPIVTDPIVYQPALDSIMS